MEHIVDTIIPFSSLKSGVYHYDFTLDDSFFSDYKNEKIQGGNVVFNVKLDRKERTLMFFFTYSGTVHTQCDRCLGELDWPIEGSQTLCVKFSDTEQSDDEEVVILPEKATQIDLAQWLYEYVAVAMPIQVLHPDDPSGAPTCDPEMMQFLSNEDDTTSSHDTDPDPRWAALEALKQDASQTN